MNADQLRLFVEVAHRGSFAAAARERDLDPSSVSRAVSSLEEELGVRLFQRTTRQMTLTEAGELYLRRMEELIQELDEAGEEVRTVSAGPAGTLRLTASVSFGTCCLVPLLPALRSAFPNLAFELILSDTNLDLIADRIDLAIRFGPNVTADVIGVKLFDTRYRVCAAPQYLKMTAPLKKPEDLKSLRCLLYTFGAFRTRWLFRDRKGLTTEVPVIGNILISNALALRESALQGLGPALLADWLIGDHLREGRLMDLFPDYDVTATNFETAAWLLYPSRAFLPNKVRAVTDFLKSKSRNIS
jgi:DNA-binding transcriptional LysR family regulator